MKIVDAISDIIFRNEENGYSVVRLERSNMTAIGVFPYISVGQEFEFTGEYIQNAKYGKQFKVATSELKPPETPDKIKQFIGSGLIQGIGPATAANIVKTFGTDTLAVMEHRPDELVVVKGVSAKKAQSIGEQFAEVKDMQKSVSFLQRFDISLNMAIRIFNKYKDATISQVQQNPYQLIETIDGVGFLTADKIAKEIGISYSGRFRVRAGIVYVLKQASDADGHTCLPVAKLFELTIRLLVIKADQLRPIFDEVIAELCLDKYLSRVGDVLALTKYYSAEKCIAANLKQLNDQQKIEKDDVEKLIIKYEKGNKIQLHDLQREAVIDSVTNGMTVITGGPGTGKTTIIKAILFINQARGHTTQLLAPTGRAAKRLEETCGFNASTIHRALDIDYKQGRGHFTYDDPDNILSADVVIVDEVSMCDVILMNQLLKKVLTGTRVILVGDIDQLASVGAGNVLEDIITSQVIPVVRLTEIYRQDALSKIVTNAHAINRGEMPDISNKSRDFFFETANNPTEIREKVISLVATRLPKYLEKSPVANGDTSFKKGGIIQVLCPMKAGEAGCIALNLALQESLNPKENGKPEITYGETIYRLGDRVMQTQNNYHQEWVKNGVSGEGVYNGDIGTIYEVNPQYGEVRVQFEDGRESTYTRSDLTSLSPSYAITVHKSQGCEFDVVVIPVTSGAYMILTRNLLYTAVTRAKTLVMLVGSSENIKKMVENTYTKRRFTMLGKLLAEL